MRVNNPLEEYTTGIFTLLTHFSTQSLPQNTVCAYLSVFVLKTDYKTEACLGLKQDTQYTYNATFRRVRIIIVAIEKQQVLDILSACL